jgi:hypothetical protein
MKMKMKMKNMDEKEFIATQCAVALALAFHAAKPCS